MEIFQNTGPGSIGEGGASTWEEPMVDQEQEDELQQETVFKQQQERVLTPVITQGKLQLEIVVAQ